MQIGPPPPPPPRVRGMLISLFSILATKICNKIKKQQTKFCVHVEDDRMNYTAESGAGHARILSSFRCTGTVNLEILSFLIYFRKPFLSQQEKIVHCTVYSIAQ